MLLTMIIALLNMNSPQHFAFFDRHPHRNTGGVLFPIQQQWYKQHFHIDNTFPLSIEPGRITALYLYGPYGNLLLIGTHIEPALTYSRRATRYSVPIVPTQRQTLLLSAKRLPFSLNTKRCYSAPNAHQSAPNVHPVQNMPTKHQMCLLSADIAGLTSPRPGHTSAYIRSAVKSKTFKL